MTRTTWTKGVKGRCQQKKPLVYGREKKNVGDVIKNRHEKLALRRDRMALVCFVVFLSIRRLSATRLFHFFFSNTGQFNLILLASTPSGHLFFIKLKISRC